MRVVRLLFVQAPQRLVSLGRCCLRQVTLPAVLVATSRSRPVRAIRARVAQLPCPRAAPLLQMVQVELCSSLLDQVALVAMCSFVVARVARVRVVMSTLPLVQVSPRRVRCPFRLETRQMGRLVLCE